MCTLLCFQAAAKMIKESMDKKFGSSWHAVVGEGYGFELTHEVKNLLYMFFGGTVAVCIWKCSWKENDIRWWTILVYIYNISDIIILWKIYWLLLKIFNIIIIRVDKIFFTIFVLSMEFDVISWLCLVLKNVSLGLGGLIWNHTLYQGKKLHWGFVNFCLLNSLPLMEGHLEILLEFPSNKFFEKCCIWTVDLFMT